MSTINKEHFDHLSFIYRTRVKELNERRTEQFFRNLSPNSLGILSVHNAFKVIAGNQRPPLIIVISFLFVYANFCERIGNLLIPALGSLLTAPERKFVDGVFSLKTYQRNLKTQLVVFTSHK